MSNNHFVEDDSSTSNAVQDEAESGGGYNRGFDENGRSDFFKWNAKAVRCLLELRLGNDAEFQHPKCRKTKLWQQISDEMDKAGYSVSGHGCDSKYRNLLITYRKNKVKALTTDECGITWEFYELMDSHLGERYDMAVENIENPTSEFEVTQQSPAIAFDPADFEERFIVRQTPTKKFKASATIHDDSYDERQMSIQSYFFEKMRFDKECHLEDSKRKARQLEIQERKLKLAEKRIELESKKVEALAALATAIASIKSVVQ